jgi:nucleotide-binding universal stress UspA family protein
MTTRSRIVCGVDFSETSRGALRSAAVVAERFGSRLVVVTVEDPLLASIEMAGSTPRPDDTTGSLRRLVAATLGARAKSMEIEYMVRVGRPAEELLHVARDPRADVIVMSSHGLTGIRKLFFGSTTERVLREADIPVLVSESGVPGPETWADMVAGVNRVLIPVDLVTGSDRQVQDALRVAEGLGVPALITHVIEPARLPFARRRDALHIDRERRARADRAIDALVEATGYRSSIEGLVAYGDPAEEIAKIARDRHAGLIVMGLRAGDSPHGRMGSVTYRVLCVSHAAVLALPPAVRAIARRGSAATALECLTVIA